MTTRTTRPRRLSPTGVIALSALVGVLFALWSVFTVSLGPPGVKLRHVEIGGATAHVVLDAPESWILDRNAGRPDFESLLRRANVLASMVPTPPVRERIGRRMGVPADQIAAVTRVTSNVTQTLFVPNLEQRANGILLSHERYRLDLQANPNRPVLTIYAQAPSAEAAERLADATVAGVREELRAMSIREGIRARWQVRMDQLGAPRGRVINAGTEPQIVLLTFLVSFGLCCALLVLVPRVRRGWVAAGREGAKPLEGPPATSPRALSLVRRPAPPSTVSAMREKLRPLVAAGGDWPHTTRVLPWMVAAFFVILWLVPFNTIELAVSSPIDLKFDRLVLPLIVGTWILALVVGGPGAPRVRGTLVHVGIGAFIVAACLSVVLSAQYLNQTLEFDLATKKLSLLIFFGILFLLVASSVRLGEVPAFLKFTLILAVLCAFGTLWEDRFQYNWFYEIPRSVLPGIFVVGEAESGGVDIFGRHLTRGPAEHPLETVAMISMALPIALVGVLHANIRRDRILYGLAICLLLAAAVSTYRKSALLGPLAVLLTLAYFRRRQLLRLAPLALPAVLLMHALSPGAFGSIVSQLHGQSLGVGTVSDRASDYDAVRPDVWSNLAFGRGYGSYDHVSYRILDSEVLNRLVDTGIVGLLTYVLMLLSVLLAARGLIRSRHPVWAPHALAVAAAAVAFLVLSFLFDITGFPHTPYILMTLAGLLAVMLQHPEATTEAPRATPRRAAHGIGRAPARQPSRKKPKRVFVDQ